MIYINITNFVLEKDHNMTETFHLKNVVIFFQTILSFVLSRKITLIELFQKLTKVYLQLNLFKQPPL